MKPLILPQTLVPKGPLLSLGLGACNPLKGAEGSGIGPACLESKSGGAFLGRISSYSIYLGRS